MRLEYGDRKLRGFDKQKLDDERWFHKCTVVTFGERKKNGAALG